MECPGGYLCSAGTSSLDAAQLCPAGYVCAEGTVDKESCPRGTLGLIGGFASPVQCRKCTAGEYCDGSIPGSIVGHCRPGFYCEEGSSSPWGELCPEGKVCPEGSPKPGLCPVGFSTLASGSASCTECAAGTKCKGGLPAPCDEGYYCEPGKDPQACPAGTYFPFQGSTSEVFCLPCTAGERLWRMS